MKWYEGVLREKYRIIEHAGGFYPQMEVRTCFGRVRWSFINVPRLIAGERMDERVCLSSLAYAEEWIEERQARARKAKEAEEAPWRVVK